MFCLEDSFYLRLVIQECFEVDMAEYEVSCRYMMVTLIVPVSPHTCWQYLSPTRNVYNLWHQLIAFSQHCKRRIGKLSLQQKSLGPRWRHSQGDKYWLR